MTLKSAVEAPIPTARVRMATTENPRWVSRSRTPYRASCRMVSMMPPPRTS